MIHPPDVIGKYAPDAVIGAVGAPGAAAPAAAAKAGGAPARKDGGGGGLKTGVSLRSFCGGWGSC